MELTSEDVRDILRVIDGLPYGELQLETARFRLSLRRAADGGWTQAMEVLAGPAGAPAGVAPAVGSEPAGPAADGMRPEASALVADDLVDVRAPLLGTFYRAPRPGAPPFVTVGSPVERDTVVCIIETMKLMNSVTAGARGTIAAILVDNAQFAEQGMVLMQIRASR